MITLDRLEQKIDALTAGVNSMLAALGNHDTWAKSTHVEANAKLEKSQREHESKQKEWREAAQSIAGLLLKLHERIDKLQPKRSVARKRKK